MPGFIRQNGNYVSFDPVTGELIDQGTGQRGTLMIPEGVEVTADPDDVARGRAQKWYKDFGQEAKDYAEWEQMPREDKLAVRNRIAQTYFQSPNIVNIWNGIQAYLGNRDPQNPYLTYGVAPAVSRAYPNASRVLSKETLKDATEGFLQFVENLSKGRVKPRFTARVDHTKFVSSIAPETIPKGFVGGVEMSASGVQPVSETGLTIREAQPFTFVNSPANPAEQAAALDFQKATGIQVPTKLSTGRPANSDEYMYPKEVLERIKTQNTPKPVQVNKGTTSQRQTAKVKAEDKEAGINRRTSDQFKEGAAYATGDARRVHLPGRTYSKMDNRQLQEILNNRHNYPASVQRRINGIMLRQKRMEEKGSPDKEALNKVRRELREYLRTVRDQYGIMSGPTRYKSGNKIHIKEKNKGKFTQYCGGTVTDSCIRRAKASGNPTLVKRATFAANVRKWKHQNGGNIDLYQVGTSVYQPQTINYPGVSLAKLPQEQDVQLDLSLPTLPTAEAQDNTPFSLPDIDFSINPYKGNKKEFKVNVEEEGKKLTEVVKERAKYLMTRLQNELGLTKEQAAGITGNIYIESDKKFNPKAVGDGGKAYGIAQWHPDRRKGLDILNMSYEDQVSYLIKELQTEQTFNTYGGLNKLRQMKTASEAAEFIDKAYERSSGEHRAQRKSYAEVYAKLKMLRGGKL